MFKKKDGGDLQFSRGIRFERTKKLILFWTGENFFFLAY